MELMPPPPLHSDGPLHGAAGGQPHARADWLPGDHHPAAGRHHLPHPLVSVRLQGSGEGRPRPYLSWLSFSRGIRFGNECSYCGSKPLQYAARLACLRHSNVSILFECALHSLPFSQKGKSSMINKYKAVIALTLQVAKLHFDLQIETCCTNNF